jgi:PAS domain S-box-containing protein
VAGEKILIVDPDTGLLHQIANQVLTPYGYKPLLVDNPDEGVRLILTQSPRLLLLHLPLDSAAQFLQRVSQTGHFVPSILMLEVSLDCIGAVFLRWGVQDYVAQPYAPEDILQAVRRVLGRAIDTVNYQQLTENLSEFNQSLEQRAKQFETLINAGLSGHNPADLDTIFNRVTETALSVTGAETGYLFILDEKTGALRLQAAQNLSRQQAETFQAAIKNSIPWSIIQSGKPILFSGAMSQTTEFKAGYAINSLLNVPLKVDNKTMGVLGVDNQTKNTRFSLVDLRRLTELAEMAATAVVNSHQYAEARREIARYIEDATTLQAVASQLSMVTDFNIGAQLALSLALRATNAEAGVLAWVADEYHNPLLYVLQGNLGQFVSTRSNGSNQEHWWDERALREVIETGQPVLAYDLGHKGNGRDKVYARSRLIIPMRRGNKVVGAINLESAEPNAFSPEDLQFVSSIADQVVIALEGTVLQEKAKMEQERLSLLMEVVDNGVWLVDVDLRLLAQNEAASQMLDWSEGEVIGRLVKQLTPTGDDSSFHLDELLSQAIKHQQRISYNEGIYLTAKNGRAVLVKVRIVPVVREGQAIGAICAFHPSNKGDEQVRFEFANMAAHLLRTPLTTIQASIDSLRSADLNIEEQQLMLDRMREQSQRMREFVKELLEMSRLEAGMVRVFAEPVALSPLLDRVLNMMRTEEPNHQFSLRVANSLPIVAADLAKTELILVNLLRHAVTRCGQAGYIGVEVELETDQVMISISDNGEAIPVAELDRIFAQFYPVDSSSGAMMSTYHLGLYTTKRLIELQNGRIWVESQPGKGSSFSFSLPVWR